MADSPRTPEDPLAAMIARIGSLVTEAGSSRDLSLYRRVGREVATLDRQMGYGSRYLSKLAEGLRESGVRGFGASMLRKCLAFALRVRASEAAILKRKGVSWRVAAQLANEHLTDEQVTQLIDKIDAGRVEAADFQDAIRAALRGRSDLTPRALDAAETNAAEAIRLLIRFTRSGSTDHQKNKAQDALRDLKAQIDEVL